MLAFGLIVPTFPFDDTGSQQFVSQILKLVDSSGDSFESMWTGDHLMPWDEAMLAKPMLESLTTVSYLAGLFQKKKIGNVVLSNSFRNPALLARIGSTLQTLTAGRFILGIGAGWIEREYRAYGYPYPSTKIRLRQLEESVQIIKRMWSEGSATFHGKYYTVENAICQPIPSPTPPLMIGGTGEKTTPRLVARYADWYNLPNISPEKYRSKLEHLKAACKTENREYESVRKTLLSLVAVSDSSEEARRIVSMTPYENPEASDNYLIGRPREIAARISEYTDLGVSLIILRFLDFPKTDGLQMFIDEVIPELSNRKLL